MYNEPWKKKKSDTNSGDNNFCFDRNLWLLLSHLIRDENYFYIT